MDEKNEQKLEQEGMETISEEKRPEVLSLCALEKAFDRGRKWGPLELTLRRGEIVVVLGDRGSGKSALISVLCGDSRADAGELYVLGEARRFRHPAEAMALGLGAVRREQIFVPSYSLLDNILMTHGGAGGPLLRRKAARAEIDRLAEQYGLQTDLSVRAGNASALARVFAQILQMLWAGCDVLLLDDVGADLFPSEEDRLCRSLRQLAQAGFAVFLASSRPSEALALRGSTLVFRKGLLKAAPEEADEAALWKLMTGRTLPTERPKRRSEPRGTVLEVRNLRMAPRPGQIPAQNISLRVRRGEVLGIPFVRGQGHESLLEALLGLRKPLAGQIFLGDVDVTHASVGELWACGLGILLPPGSAFTDIPVWSLRENAILEKRSGARFSPHGLLLPQMVQDYAAQCVQALDLPKGSVAWPVAALSKGQRQCFAMERRLGGEPEVWVVFQPTRGLDEASRQHVHDVLRKQRVAGKAILLVTSDMDELFSLSRRILLLHYNGVTAELDATLSDRATLGHLLQGEYADA